jgi:hypothetical protein
MQGKNLMKFAFFLFGINQTSLNSFMLYEWMDEEEGPMGGTRIEWDRTGCWR